VNLFLKYHCRFTVNIICIHTSVYCVYTHRHIPIYICVRIFLTCILGHFDATLAELLLAPMKLLSKKFLLICSITSFYLIVWLSNHMNFTRRTNLSTDFFFFNVWVLLVKFSDSPQV
jgi:hypothetical protein